MSKFHAIYGKGGDTPGGDTYGEVQVLLWTNSTPSVAFAAQTVTVDLTEYDGVIVEFTDTSNPTKINGRIKVSKTPELFGVGSRVVNETFARNISSLNDSGIGFSDCYRDTSLFNTGFVPLKIYGYRQYEAGTIEFNWSVSSSTNASEPIALNNTYTAPLDGYYKRSNITGFTSASSNLTTEFAYKKAGDTITLNVSKSEGVQKPSTMTIYYSSKRGN